MFNLPLAKVNKNTRYMHASYKNKVTIHSIVETLAHPEKEFYRLCQQLLFTMINSATLSLAVQKIVTLKDNLSFVYKLIESFRNTVGLISTTRNINDGLPEVSFHLTKIKLITYSFSNFFKNTFTYLYVFCNSYIVL